MTIHRQRHTRGRLPSGRWRGVVVVILFLVSLPRTTPAGDAVDFQADVRPILQDRCGSCHGGIKQTAGLSVIDRPGLLSPTDSGEPVVIPGDAEDSPLVWRIRSDDPFERMPPDEPLEPEEIELLARWIDDGAPWPQHWAYAPLAADLSDAAAAEPTPPEHPIDQFVRARLADEGIEPSPPADPRTLLRRLSLDLTGLLPTPEEMDALVNDSSPDAYQQAVDRLLDSPHFGERWARHWLDQARYADSEGYEKDSPKADAFRYRDWVISAINEDLPFDQFTIRQIAGDLLPDRTDDDLLATKFHLQTQFNLEGGVDSEEDRTKRVIDRINTIGTVWLAMTIECAQCHDHPYDPLPQTDFYGLYAFFNNADFAADFLGDPPEDAEELRRQRQQKWEDLSDLLRRQVTDKNLATQTQRSLTQLRRYDNANGFTRYLQQRRDDRRPTYRFERGDFLRPAKEEGEVTPNTPEPLPPLEPRGDRPDRLDLARWLVRHDNPLTARVTVNKVWMHLFGEPLAAQVGDFGSRGAEPSHPELLDWLAQWFVEEAGWSRKALIRLIVTSQTYRQSSAIRPELREIDPANRLLARQNRFRVEAEILRDIALQASGLLSRKIGGPSVFPPLPEIIAEQTYAGNFKYRESEGGDRYRRGLYTFFRRTALDPNLTTFDCPDASVSKPQRDRSNNALQALALLQNEVFHEAAQAFAARLLQREGPAEYSDRQRIEAAFRIALGRRPAEEERAPLEKLLAEARDYYRDHPDDAAQLVGRHRAENVQPAENAAWVTTARVVLNMDEFITRD